MEDGSPASRRRRPSFPASPTASIFRVLNNLLILDGERLSYRTLDVEQIGSVYEAMMGMDLDVAEGRSIALRLPRRTTELAPRHHQSGRTARASPQERKKALIDTDRMGSFRPNRV